MGVSDYIGNIASVYMEVNDNDISSTVSNGLLNVVKYSNMVKQLHNGDKVFREPDLGNIFTFQQSDIKKPLSLNIPCLVNGNMEIRTAKSGPEDVQERRSRPRIRNLKLDIPDTSVTTFDKDNGAITNDDIPSVSDAIAKFDVTRQQSKRFIPIVGERRSRSLSPCLHLPSPSKSATVRPVSPRIQHLCSRFLREENQLPESEHIRTYNANDKRRRSSAVDGLTINNVGASANFLSNNQKPSQESTDNRNSWTMPDGELSTMSNTLYLKNCLSPCISPSSGYGSGRYSSSPVNLSPRCSSPVGSSGADIQDSLLSHTKASRTQSVDSGHHSTNLDNSDFQSSITNDEPFDRNSKLNVTHHSLDLSSSPRKSHLSRASHVFDSTELDVPETIIYRPSSPVDEGFEDGNKPVNNVRIKANQAQNSSEIKRTQLTVRLKSPDLLGSSLKPMSLSLKPKLSKSTSNMTWSSASFSSVELLQSPPAVIVTDDYCNNNKDNETPSLNLPVTCESDTTVLDVPQSDSTLVATDDNKVKKKQLLRKLSSVSTGSSFSFDESEQEDVDDTPSPTMTRRKRLMQWKKIRTLVHWSPFVQSYKRRYPWVQLAGHKGNFECAEDGDILKKYCEREQEALQALMDDVLRPYIPKYKGEAEKNGEKYIQMQDLLLEFENPCVMDCKIGTRTYIEEELKKAREKPKLRKDMYQKMIEIDPDEPTDEERAQQAIIKPRYMQWRENVSSSASLGFRIEGVKKADGTSSRNFKTTKERQEIQEHFTSFVDKDPTTAEKYVSTLKAIRATLGSSTFFAMHEVIGSSLLFIHDKSGRTGIWMIDFGKTIPLPDSMKNDHRTPWVEGNHEDGYLFGVDNLIDILNNVAETCTLNETPSTIET